MLIETSREHTMCLRVFQRLRIQADAATHFSLSDIVPFYKAKTLRILRITTQIIQTRYTYIFFYSIPLSFASSFTHTKLYIQGSIFFTSFFSRLCTFEIYD